MKAFAVLIGFITPPTNTTDSVHDVEKLVRREFESKGFFIKTLVVENVPCVDLESEDFNPCRN